MIMITLFSGLPQNRSRAGGLHRRGRAFILRELPPAQRSLFHRGKGLFGRDRHPKECDCQRKRREKQEAADRERKHRDTVEELKRRGFSNAAMRQWTFENDNGKCPKWIRLYSMRRTGRK